MSDHSTLPVPAEPARASVTTAVALDGEMPPIAELFAFMADAELRFRSLRMRIEERTMTARGESLVVSDVLVRHEGWARVTRRRSAEPMSRDYDVWATDGEHVTTYDAAAGRASVRRLMRPPVGATATDLPPFARVRPQLTRLPAESLPDAFVHPEGFLRNVALTGVTSYLGGAMQHGRQTFLLRVDHPRSTYLLTDRPDRWVELGVDRQTGIITRLVEHIGELVTRHAEVVSLEVDAAIPDEAFTVHLPEDVRRIY